MKKIPGKVTLGGLLLQHVIVFLICIVFPGATTMFAPASWITFQRSSDGVRCTARTCAFFVVPFKVQQIDQVTAISQRERSSEIARERKGGRDTGNYVHVDGEGFLQVLGAGDRKIEVSVSPVSLDSAVDKSNAFLSDSSASSRTFFVIANWKFGGLMGGVLTSFTALYVVGYGLSIIAWVVKKIKLAV